MRHQTCCDINPAAALTPHLPDGRRALSLQLQLDLITSGQKPKMGLLSVIKHAWLYCAPGPTCAASLSDPPAATATTTAAADAAVSSQSTLR